MTSARKRVLVTGASGSVGRALLPYLERHYALTLFVGPSSTVGARDLGVAEADVVSINIADRNAVLQAVSGVDAIVHLAGQSHALAGWDELLAPNIEGAYNVFEAARIAGVGTVVFASSNWATGAYDRDEEWPIHPYAPVRPGTLYGATKAFGETLGRYFSDYHGIKVVCLRIGWYLERPHNEMALRMWLSERDLHNLVHRSIETTNPFGIYYGASANTRLKWDLSNAKTDLGYQPVDNSEDYASEVLGK